MQTRQALIALSLLAGVWACTPSNQSTPTPTIIPSTPLPVNTSTPSPPAPTFTPTPLACLIQPGRVEQGSITATNPAQEFLIFLPPCYDELTAEHYPVLYLLHGQTYTDDQWLRLGAADIASRLIVSGETLPFIIVFPDDRYWNLPPGAGFGGRLIDLLIPYVDKNYRTIADRDHRALGGLSRGGGWTLRLGFTHPALFGALGLHSPVVFIEDGPYLEKWIRDIPPDARPDIWFDIGDRDQELGNGLMLQQILTDSNYLHEFHLYAGDHSEAYWRLHVEEYLRWYTGRWNKQSQ